MCCKRRSVYYCFSVTYLHIHSKNTHTEKRSSDIVKMSMNHCLDISNTGFGQYCKASSGSRERGKLASPSGNQHNNYISNATSNSTRQTFKNTFYDVFPITLRGYIYFLFINNVVNTSKATNTVLVWDWEVLCIYDDAQFCKSVCDNTMNIQSVRLSLRMEPFGA